MEKNMLTPAVLQREWGIGRNTVYALVNRADFPKIRVGRRILIPRDALNRWLDKQIERALG